MCIHKYEDIGTYTYASGSVGTYTYASGGIGMGANKTQKTQRRSSAFVKVLLSTAKRFLNNYEL